jgi:hypothetical protein
MLKPCQHCARLCVCGCVSVQVASASSECRARTARRRSRRCTHRETRSNGYSFGPPSSSCRCCRCWKRALWSGLASPMKRCVPRVLSHFISSFLGVGVAPGQSSLEESDMRYSTDKARSHAFSRSCTRSDAAGRGARHDSVSLRSCRPGTQRSPSAPRQSTTARD